MLRALVLALLTLALLPVTASAQQRFGLVIGNDSYHDVPDLELARADAAAIADALSEQGFEIVTLLDGSRRDMNRTISDFTHRLQPGDTAFVFFAGHGVEIDGENYLLPTDIVAPAAGERDFIKSESIALSALLDRIRVTGARTTIAVIDACRDNPFATTAGRSIGSTRGLGRITAPQGTFVIFSAGAGQLALDRLGADDTGKNSVFTRLLLPRLADPGLELRAMMADLRREVRDLARTVNHDQFPAYYDELLGQFYFAATPPPASATKALPAPADPATNPIREDFALARSIGSVEAYDAFLERYGETSDDFTVQLARQLRNALVAESDQTAPEPPVAVASVLDIPSLGSQAALDALSSDRAVACPAAAPQASTAASPATGDAAPTYTLTGSWSFSAKCALFVKSHGTVRFSPVGGNRYKATISDNLGNNGHADVVLNGRSISSTEYFPSITNRFHGQLAADGNSYSGSGSNTCAVYARRN